MENNIKEEIIESGKDVSAEIAELEKLNELVQQESKAVTDAKITSPVNTVENSLASFVSNAFEVTNNDFIFGQELQASLLEDLPEMNANQKIALYSSYAVNNNDKISKLLSPIMGLMTARQQAEFAAAAQVASHKVDVEVQQKEVELNKNASTELLQSMSALRDFMSLVNKKD